MKHWAGFHPHQPELNPNGPGGDTISLGSLCVDCGDLRPHPARCWTPLTPTGVSRVCSALAGPGSWQESFRDQCLGLSCLPPAPQGAEIHQQGQGMALFSLSSTQHLPFHISYQLVCHSEPQFPLPSASPQPSNEFCLLSTLP